MTEQTVNPEVTVPELEIEFMGRTLLVRFPKPEQLLVWKRTLRQLQSADVDGWNAEQVMNALERTRRIIDSMMVNSADVTWLDDEMLAGNVDLRGASEIINTTVTAYADMAEREKAENGTRAERRAAKKTPGKKATRKKVER
jgi:hypothetical protein